MGKNVWGNGPSDVNGPKAERAHRSVAWESVGRAVWRKCRPDPLASPALLNQSLHFTKRALLQHLVDSAR